MERTVGFVLLVSCFVICFSNCQAINEASRLQRYIDRKCAGPNAQKVKEIANILTNELDRAFGYIPDHLKHFCTNEKPFLINLMKNNFSVPFRRCVSDQEAYLPQFAEQSFVGFLHFICHKQGENIAMFFGKEGQLCIAQFKNASRDLDECFSGLLGPTGSAVMKDDICYNLRETRRCFRGLLDQFCPGGTVLPRLNDRLFKDLSDPCEPPEKQRFRPHAIQGTHAAAHAPNSASLVDVNLAATILAAIVTLRIYSFW